MRTYQADGDPIVVTPFDTEEPPMTDSELDLESMEAHELDDAKFYQMQAAILGFTQAILGGQGR